MAPSTVPISETSHRMLHELAQHTGQSVTHVLDKALAAYHRKVFFEELNAGYAALRSDPDALHELETERALWDATISDGLEPDERWTEDGRCLMSEIKKE